MTDPSVAFWDDLPAKQAEAFFAAYVASHRERVAQFAQVVSHRWPDIGATVEIATLDAIWERWWSDPLPLESTSAPNWYPNVGDTTITEVLPRWTPFDLPIAVLELGTGLDAWFAEIALRELRGEWFMPTRPSGAIAHEGLPRSILNRPALRFPNGRIVESRHLLDVVHYASVARMRDRPYPRVGAWHHLIQSVSGQAPAAELDLSLDIDLDRDAGEAEGRLVWQISFPPEVTGDQYDIVDRFVAAVSADPTLSAVRSDREWAEVTSAANMSREDLEAAVAPLWRGLVDDAEI